MGLGSDEWNLFAVEQLLARGRTYLAVQIIATRLTGSHEPGIPADVIIRVLEETLSAPPPGTGPVGSFDYEVSQLLDELGRLKVSEEIVAKFEWAYFTVLHHTRPARALFRMLAGEPSMFVDLVAKAFRGASERPRQLDEQTAQHAQNAWAVLADWRTNLPGQNGDGSFDGPRLRQWVRQARILLADVDRVDVGDEQIGQVLSGSPNGIDGAWPAEPVRELIEELGSEEFETGLRIGKMNMQGASFRGLYEGGGQEREQAAGYREWARITGKEWHRTSRLLRRIAERYESRARRMDEEAEARADGE